MKVEHYYKNNIIDDLYRPICTLDYVDADTAVRGQLKCLLGSGCPKSCIAAEAPYRLLHEKDLTTMQEISFGKIFCRGYISGKILDKDVVFKCYGLLPDSVITALGEFHCIIGAKTMDKLGLYFLPGKPPTIKFREGCPLIFNKPTKYARLLTTYSFRKARARARVRTRARVKAKRDGDNNSRGNAV
jgi:hypothetical protein